MKENAGKPGRPLSYSRGVWRTAILIASLLEAQARFLAISLLSAGRVSQHRRASWLHDSCARILKRLEMPLTVIGRPPERGESLQFPALIVSNHLSYLDVLIYGAVAKVIFVAKSEVRRWPLFGALASAGGTVFVDRSSGSQSPEASRKIEERLREGIHVLLFPEGTSSDGTTVLPFRSSLFEPAIRAGASVTAAAIRYHPGEAPEAEISYWGEMVFFPHLFRTLGLRTLSAEIRFAEPRCFADRKTASSAAWQQVLAFRDRGSERNSGSEDAHEQVAAIRLLVEANGRKHSPSKRAFGSNDL